MTNTKRSFSHSEYERLTGVIVFLVMLVLVLALVLTLTLLDQSRCYELLIICGGVVISDGQCVRYHHTEEIPVRDDLFIKRVRFWWCDGGEGEPWQLTDGCRVAIGEGCAQLDVRQGRGGEAGK